MSTTGWSVVAIVSWHAKIVMDKMEWENEE